MRKQQNYSLYWEAIKILVAWSINAEIRFIKIKSHRNEKIKHDTKPYNIQIDISGVTDLKIDIDGAGGVDARYGYTMLADPVLSE